MTAPPSSQNSRIAVRIEVPGLRMNPLVAMSFAGLLTEPIRLALESENLLSPQPLSPSAKDDVLDAINEAARLRQSVPANVPAVEAIFATVKKGLLEVLANRGVQAFAYFDWFLFLADVADTERSLSIIKAELARLEVLRFSEIAWFQPGESPAQDRFLTFWPPASNQPFERHWPLVKNLAAYGRNLLKGETFAETT